MRRRGSLSAYLVIGLAIAVLHPFGVAEAGANKPVKVDAKCPTQDDGKFTISVDPLEVVVEQGQGVEWSLKTNNNRNEGIEIAAKDPEDWLYVDTSVKGNKTAVMTEMHPDSTGKTYDYKITVYCGENDEPVVLDPRIKVGGG